MTTKVLNNEIEQLIMILYAAYTELAPDTATVAPTVCLFTVMYLWFHYNEVTIEMKTNNNL